MTASPHAVLAATFAPGETAVTAAMRFTREVMTAWATGGMLHIAEQVAGDLAAQVVDEPFEVIWKHYGRCCPGRGEAAKHVTGRSEGSFRQRGGVGRHLRGRFPCPLGQAHATRLRRTRWAPNGWSRAARGPHWLGFLADASDLLAGTLDPDMVPAIIAQIVVPRLASWCAVYTADSASGPLRLVYLWHADEARIDGLREQLAEMDVRRRRHPRRLHRPPGRLPGARRPADRARAAASA